MAQHFLNGAQVCAVFQQMHRERVAQRVRRDVLVDLRHLLIVLDDLPKALTAHALAVHVDEQRRLLGIGQQLRADILDVIRKCLDRSGIERNDALLALALAADEAGGKAAVALVERDELAHADAGGVEQLEHRVIAVALGVHAPGLVEEQLDLLAGQDLREPALDLEGSDALGGIGLDLAALSKEGIKGLDGGQRARDRRGGLPLAAHPRDVVADGGGLDLAQIGHPLGGKVLGKLAQVAKIGAERIFGGVLFLAQIILIELQIIGRHSAHLLP